MAEKFKIFKEFERIGRELFLAGLNNTHSGNMSCLLGREVLITATGAMLGSLRFDQLITVPKNGVSRDDTLASVELPLHRAVYNKIPTAAVVHTHPPLLIAMSLTEERIMPIDEEGKHYSPEGIAVVEARNAIGTEESAQIVSEALQNSTGVILRGHGMFARGESLEEAAKIISSAEHSARILMNYLMYHRMK